MAVPQLPPELVIRIVRTARYIERLETLHDSQLWRSIRWYVGNRDVQQVPRAWESVWLRQLIRALLNSSVRRVHLESLAARCACRLALIRSMASAV